MSRTRSTMLPLGTEIPDFSLPDVVSNKDISLAHVNGKNAKLIIFMCNHCPYVKNVKQALVQLANDYKNELGIIAISANDVDEYPKDGPQKMAEDAKKQGYPFPYLYDETQETAKAYKAACTPDFFLADADNKLVYRGQFDDSRPSNGIEPSGSDLRQALDQLLAGKTIPEDQKPSMGCNIKWKKGNAPAYFG